MSRFIFTCGDINGIGPEIVIKSLNRISKKTSNEFVFICPKNVFLNTAKQIKPNFDYDIKESLSDSDKSNVTILNIGNTRQNVGEPTKLSGETAYRAIKLSSDLLNSGQADAVVTAPISKAAINSAGKNFHGHTEMYAKWSGAKNFVMMFLSNKLNSALITIHEPIKRVPKLLTTQLIDGKLRVITKTLVSDLRIKSPRIAVLGLNPHAGENGVLGNEEKNIIKPVIKKYKNVFGPFSSDAFFGNKTYLKYDIVVGMYHDQALIPFKLLNFSKGVNYTAGLPIVRTSPDHGTAFDIAGKGIADESSFYEAYKTAQRIVNNRCRK